MTFPIFAAGDVLRATDMNAVGMWKVASVSFTNASTSSPVVFLGCFSSTYKNYLLKWNTSSGGANQEIFGQFLSGSTPATTNDYRFAQTGSNNFSQVANNGNSAIGGLSMGYTLANGASGGETSFYNPNLAVRTVFFGDFIYDDGGTLIGRRYAGLHNLANAYTGFRFYPNAGVMTGTATIYGYTD
jgi:hypothetical protein